MLGAQEGPLEVHVQYCVPLVFRQFSAGGDQVSDAGVVDQDVQAAEALDGVFHRRLDLGLDAHVKRESFGDAAPVPNALHHGPHRVRGSNVMIGHVFARRFAQVRDQHAGAALGQLRSDAFAQAARPSGAGNERDLAT